MSMQLPFYDYKLDFDGQLVLEAGGVELVTDEDLIKQHARNILLLNFKGSDYTSLPNNESTGNILKMDITDILNSDIFLQSIGLEPIVEVYPQDLNSIAFSIILSNQSMQVDVGIENFINLRSGVLVGYGDFKLEPTIYSQNVKKVYERFQVVRKRTELVLTRPMVPGTTPYILTADQISGFSDGMPVPYTTTQTGSFSMYPGINLIAISDILPSIGFLRVYNITLTQDDGETVPTSKYSVVGTYLVFNSYTYTGTVTVTASLVNISGDVTKYNETNGIHPVDIYPSARENKEYLVHLSGNMERGTYFIIYDSYEVLQ